MKRFFFIMTATLVQALPAFAEEAVSAAVAAEGGITNKGLIALAAGLGLGLAAVGGAYGQGKIGAAAMDGIARNPQAQKAMFVPMLLALVFVETLVLFTFLVTNGMAGLLK